MIKYIKRLLTGQPKPVWVVQLHRADAPNWRTGDYSQRILSSWAPIECCSDRQAREVAHCLRMDNRWGNADCHPCVTITDPDGTRRVA